MTHTSKSAPPGTRRRHGVLIVVQNLSVPLDRRVWLECQALMRAEYRVCVICPRGPGERRAEELEGVHIYRYAPAPQASGLLGYAFEFAYSWVRTTLLSVRAWREHGFEVLQACNPPDTYWALGLLWRVRRVKFVYDQHDLNPELFLSRFGEPQSRRARWQLRVLLWLERMSYRTAEHVVSTNESYRAVALGRGGRKGRDVTVVRSGPDTREMRPVRPSPSVRRGARHLLVYLGIMGPQDGVENTLKVLNELVHVRARTDVRLALLGFGDCLEQLKKRARELALDDHVTFTGRADPAMVADYLSSADVGLCPDPKTPLNDVSTMNKTMEYMSYCLPSVSFDLVETKVSAADSALYVPSGDIRAFADAVEQLLDHPDLRVTMGLAARRRVTSQLDWRPQSVAYVSVFDDITGRRSVGSGAACVASACAGEPPRRSATGSAYVNLDDEDGLRNFIRWRGTTRQTVSDTLGES